MVVLDRGTVDNNLGGHAANLCVSPLERIAHPGILLAYFGNP